MTEPDKVRTRPTHNWRIRRFNFYRMHANGTLQ
ncbi:hypothetical protein I3843_01G070100 [Carya illinoinensis]|uniref:Uncharacterized protein n=1 Tax=Carya illinoinensis TaxID=32201 RepID=A0A922G2W0_CARIL|nr:hypothetical protein I3842_01G071500 [Carya illinoinensis]KAG7994667.1 hypothetical protein I3843_01G070100 [Carya illinoinensis]